MRMPYKICTDIETSKKLRNIKLNLETPFYWVQGMGGCDDTYYLHYNDEDDDSSEKFHNCLPAYTFEQLYNSMAYINDGTTWIVDLGIKGKRFYVAIDGDENAGENGLRFHYVQKEPDQNLANLAANMVLFLLKGNIFRIEDFEND